MIDKSDSRCAVVRFCYHPYDYRSNWTPLSPFTITNNNNNNNNNNNGDDDDENDYDNNNNNYSYNQNRYN